MSHALVYNYFGDRGGLLAAVYLHTFSQLNDVLNTSIRTCRRRTASGPSCRLPPLRRRPP